MYTLTQFSRKSYLCCGCYSKNLDSALARTSTTHTQEHGTEHWLYNRTASNISTVNITQDGAFVPLEIPQGRATGNQPTGYITHREGRDTFVSIVSTNQSLDLDHANHLKTPTLRHQLTASIVQAGHKNHSVIVNAKITGATHIRLRNTGQSLNRNEVNSSAWPYCHMSHDRHPEPI